LGAGLSYREIAEVTGMTTSNVGFHLHEAVRNIRQILAT
jgi:RNA polymerase sigma-70 factor (ECF subfamily)